MFTALVLSLMPAALAIGDGASEPVSLSGAGVSVVVPRGLNAEEATAERLIAKGKGINGLSVEFSPFQVPVDEAAAKAWGRRASAWVGRVEGVEDSEVTSVSVQSNGGRDEAHISAQGKAGDRVLAYAEQRSLAVEGGAVHVVAVARTAQEATSILDAAMSQLELTHPPADLAALSKAVSAPAGFGTTLPDGWRPPLANEIGRVRHMGQDTKAFTLDAETCWSAVHPHPEGDVDLLVSCKEAIPMSILDEHSVEGEELILRKAVFGGQAESVQPGRAVSAGDRQALIWGLDLGGQQHLGMAITPMGDGAVRTLMVGRFNESATLVPALEQTLAATTFTSPESAQTITFGHWMMYAFNYRMGLVALALSPLLLGLGLLFKKIAGSKPSYADI